MKQEQNTFSLGAKCLKIISAKPLQLEVEYNPQFQNSKSMDYLE